MSVFQWFKAPERPSEDERIEQEKDEAKRAAMKELGTADADFSEDPETGLIVVTEKPEPTTGQYL